MPTQPQLWERVEELFHAALACPSDARRAFLDQHRGGNDELRGRVEALLDGHRRVEAGFLEPLTRDPVEGRRIGDFTLQRLIGSGGMGAVYEATQLHPSRTVALKIVRPLAGVARDARRVALEAELMARLSHPNVAQIHAAGMVGDAGGTLAWFAMELVRGAQDILTWARDHDVDITGRIELFQSACRAVEHGHRNGVIHRDLKPENILVNERGIVKVIDFGIARAAGTEQSAATLSIHKGQVLGTLAYMSPEQARDGSSSTDTATDVYSLGVVLYELLTGERPLRVSGKSFTEALAMIQTTAPVNPSTLNRELAGDLEAIVLKTLEKDPVDRYAGVSELLADLEHYQRHEPIMARIPSAWRRSRLFARRHRTAVAALAVILVVSIVAAIYSSIQAIHATSAARAEQRARIHAERVARLHERIFTFARPSSALGRAVSVREILDDALFAGERELAGHPLALSDLLSTLGTTYSDLGELESAERVLMRSQELAQGAATPEEVAQTRLQLAFVLIARGQYAKAEQHLRDALTVFSDSSPAHAEGRVCALYRLSELLRLGGRASEAQAAIAEAFQLCRDVAEVSPTTLARVLNQMGNQSYGTRDFARAETLHREALDIYERILPANHPTLGAACNSLANDLFDLSRVDDAERLWNRALRIFELVLDPTHPDLATVVGNLALVYQRRRDFERAGAAFDRALTLRRAALGEDHPGVAHMLSRYSAMFVARGDLRRAEELAAQAVAVRQRSLEHERKPGADPALASELFALALVQRQAKRLVEAEATLRETVRVQETCLAQDHPDLAQSLTLLGAVLLDAQRPAEAEPMLRRALQIRATRLPGNWLTANTRSVLGGCLTALGRFEEAEPLLRDSLSGIEQALGPADFRVREARERLVELYERMDRLPDARTVRGLDR